MNHEQDIENLFAQSRQHHNNQDFPEAEQGYLKLLKLVPDHPQFCYLLAILYFENNATHKAKEWFNKTVSIAPEAAPAHYNLGIIHFEQNNFQEAISSYQQALLFNPEDIDSLFNLALSYKEIASFQEARQAYEKILTINPAEVETLYNLGVLSKDQGHDLEAIDFFEKAIAIAPDHAKAHNNLGYLYHKHDQPEQAITTYKKLIELDHNKVAARHMLAALTGKTTTAAPVQYIKDVFDQFSGHYEQGMVNELEYNTPNLLRELLKSNQPSCHFKHGLDMGCGTSLSGLALRQETDILTGLDLSPGILAVAAEKNIYQALHEQDILTFLKNTKSKYDLFIAADVFVYIGDLNEIFASIDKASLRPATFLFSTEITATGFTLKQTGRYGHSEQYIMEMAEKHNFIIKEMQPTNIRKEKGEWITGTLYLLQIP